MLISYCTTSMWDKSLGETWIMHTMISLLGTEKLAVLTLQLPVKLCLFQNKKKFKSPIYHLLNLNFNPPRLC